MSEKIRGVPELPDIALYLHALEPRVIGARLERIRLASPFLLRSVTPAPSAAAGRTVLALRRLGKPLCSGSKTSCSSSCIS